MTADLIAALRRLALFEDLPECAQAADLIERLVAEAHPLAWSWVSSQRGRVLGGCGRCQNWCIYTDEGQAHAAHAAHVAAILDGSGT